MVLSKLGAGLIIAILMLPIATNAQTENTTPIKLETKESVDLSKDVEISADELEANLRKDIVVFVGNVAISQKDLLLTADRVTVFYQTEENTKSSINRIDASGSVHLTTKTEAIDSTWGIYDFTDKIITLGGKVILKRSDGEVTGKKLIYNLDSGLITIEGSAKNNNRVKGQFTLPEKK
ncbi:MAG: lipopolysaccharide transport periplasmic protein LptA [Emcibacter sp.]|nr:lipopolysaccharide transport periplasmic protein LptA [Emcibacter sp.]